MRTMFTRSKDDVCQRADRTSIFLLTVRERAPSLPRPRRSPTPRSGSRASVDTDGSRPPVDGRGLAVFAAGGRGLAGAGLVVGLLGLVRRDGGVGGLDLLGGHDRAPSLCLGGP